MVAVLILAPLALVGALFPSFSRPATVYVLAVGGVLACLGLSGRLTRRAAAGPLPASARPLPAPRPAPLAETAADAAVAPGAGTDRIPTGPDHLPPTGPGSGPPAGPGGTARPGPESVPAADPDCDPFAEARGGAARRQAPRRPSPVAAWWLVPALALGAIELTDLVLGSTYPHPTLSVLLDPVLDHYPARAVAYFGWLAAFWGLVRR